MMKTIRILLGCAMLFAMEGYGASFEREKQALLGRAHAMSHGYYAEAEWQEVFSGLHELRADAKRDGRPDRVIEIDRLEALIYSELRGDRDRALERLDATRRAYDQEAVATLKRVYTQMAELYAAKGDEQAIADLIRAFKESAHYDPVQYPYTGGSGPEDPLRVTRPRAVGADSMTVSTMERYRRRARYAPGRRMPEIEGTDQTGRTVRLSDFRGQLVLVDFWFPEFPAWRRDLPNLRNAYHRYQPRGFHVLGIPLGRRQERNRAFIREQNMTWPQLTVGREVAAQFGVFGDVTNFLVDANGIIVGRDLRGGNLDHAIEVMLERQ